MFSVFAAATSPSASAGGVVVVVFDSESLVVVEVSGSGPSGSMLDGIEGSEADDWTEAAEEVDEDGIAEEDESAGSESLPAVL